MAGRLKRLTIGVMVLAILAVLMPLGSARLNATVSGDQAGAQTSNDACVLFAPADISNNDRFGSSMGIDGDVLAVSAWLGDPEQTVDAGAVYIYERGLNGAWRERQKLTAGVPQVGAGFGFSVDIDGDTLAVGAYDEAIDVTGATGTETILSAGAVYVFERQAGGRWQQQGRLTADQPGQEDFFGHNVEVDAATETVVVGVPGHDLLAQDSTPEVSDAGAAFVFVKSEAGEWDKQSVLIDPNAQPGDRAGNDVAISGDRVVVGHHLDDRADGRTLSNAGGALVYSRFESEDGIVWGGPVELDGSEARRRDRAGIGVDIDGNVLVMTGWAQQPGDRAVAWVFERGKSGGGASDWVERARIEPDQASVDGSHFGRHVELSGSVLTIGASLDDRIAVDGGAVYYYARAGGEWLLQAEVSPAPPTDNAQAGISLAVSAEWTAIGAERAALGAVNSGGACLVPLASIVEISAMDQPAVPDAVTASEGVVASAQAEDGGRGPGELIPRRWSSTRGIVFVGGAVAAAVLLVGVVLIIVRRRT